MKKLSSTLLCLVAATLCHAATSADSPLWQTWDKDSKMIQEWKKLVASEAWKGNKIGIDHEVPPPWTKMTIKNGTIGMWGRTWHFDGKALPQKIVSQGEALLNTPLRFRALIDGKWHTSTPGKGKVVSAFDDQIIYEGETVVSGVKIKSRFILEFDGFVWLTFKLSGSDKVQRLALEFPFRKDFAMFYRKQSEGLTPKAVRDRWGRVTKSRKIGPLKPYYANDFGFTNDTIGIDFVAEGTNGWHCKKFDRRIEWLVSENEVLCRFNFIDNPPNGKYPDTTVEFGCNVMPFRPVDVRARAYFIYSWHATGWKYNEIKASPSPAIRIISPYYWGWEAAKKRKSIPDHTAPSAIPIPRHPEKFMGYMKKIRSEKPGTKIVYYAVGDLHTDYDPVFIKNSEKWKGGNDKLDLENITKYLTKRRGTLRRVCGWNQEYVDYKVFCLVYWAKKIGLDGYYWDDQNFMPCVNRDHQEHLYFDCNGNTCQVKPIRQYREMTKRIYKAIKKFHPDSIFIGHTFPPHSPFSETAAEGEVWRKLTGDKEFYSRIVDPHDCRNVCFNSHIDGCAKSFLPEYMGDYYIGKNARAAGRAMLAFLWMTDLSVWQTHCDDRELLFGFLHPRGAFGVNTAEYLPWHKQQLASMEGERVFCTLFRKKDKVLIAISNLSRKTVENTLNMDLIQLFPDYSTGELYSIKAVNAENRQPLKLSLMPAQAGCFAEIKLKVPGDDFRLVELNISK